MFSIFLFNNYLSLLNKSLIILKIFLYHFSSFATTRLVSLIDCVCSSLLLLLFLNKLSGLYFSCFSFSNCSISYFSLSNNSSFSKISAGIHSPFSFCISYPHILLSFSFYSPHVCLGC
jgi:uncharacterized membrane protein